jgi:hypothetical protein
VNQCQIEIILLSPNYCGDERTLFVEIEDERSRLLEILKLKIPSYGRYHREI